MLMAMSPLYPLKIEMIIKPGVDNGLKLTCDPIGTMDIPGDVNFIY